jgi:hypothetical protein
MKNFVRAVFHTIGKWIFWSYNRKSWQYDVLCLIFILALIFIPIKGPQADALKKNGKVNKSTLVYRSKGFEYYIIAFYGSKSMFLEKKAELNNLISAIKQLTKM